MHLGPLSALGSLAGSLSPQPPLPRVKVGLQVPQEDLPGTADHLVSVITPAWYQEATETLQCRRRRMQATYCSAGWLQCN